jgi:hypothetical protein
MRSTGGSSGRRSGSHRRGRLGAVLAAGLLVAVAACSGDDDDGESGRADPAAESDQAGSDADETGADDAEQDQDGEVVDPYDGHTSEVYDGTTNWMCHPDLDDDLCRDLSATRVDADGTLTPADMEVATDPAIDCFYVYPTVSTDPGLNSDLTPNGPETNVVVTQAALFAQTCRMFAPAYRQVTLNGLGGGASGSDAGETAYADVLDAWQTYLAQYIEGRGVVLIGHSQGTGHLGVLIAREIDPEPELRERLVSALLLGGTVDVPDGEDVGGSFEEVPACREEGQTGCVVSFSTYPLDTPPRASAFFGRAGGGRGSEPDPDLRAMCVDPVALSGGEGVADAIIPTSGAAGTDPEIAAAIDTTYIVLPQLLAARCERTEGFDYFAVGRASEDDQRVRAIDGLTAELLGPDWGLHLYDANVAMGNLLAIVATQAEAFASGSTG